MINETTPEGGRPINGRHVLFGFVGFFAIVFAVNGVFLAKALSTRTGVVAEEPYLKGLKYNQRIAADEIQTSLGWRLDLSVTREAGKVVALMTDRQGAPLSRLVATMLIGRPATTAEDLTVQLVEVGPGRYEAALPPGGAGAYVADIGIARAGNDDVIFKARRRLWVAQ